MIKNTILFLINLAIERVSSELYIHITFEFKTVQTLLLSKDVEFIKVRKPLRPIFPIGSTIGFNYILKIF